MNDEPESPGWDAIDRALAPLYKDVKPKHYGTLVSYQLGGPDPLRGISAYKRLEPVTHWHFVTYGFSELFAKESDDKEVSGYGFELTFRLKTDPAAEDPPSWALNFLQNLARYVFKSGNVFAAGHYLNLNGPIMAGDPTAIRSVACVQDPELPPIETPHGKLDFLQVVGITLEEERAFKQWSTLNALALFAARLPLFVTDLRRSSLMAEASIAAALLEGAKRDGSKTGALFMDQLGWEKRNKIFGGAAYAIITGAQQIAELLAVLPYRLPFNRDLRLSCDKARVLLTHGAEVEITPSGEFLRVALDAAALARFVADVKPKAGAYEISRKPALVLEVRKTEIKDRDGKVVETIG